MTEPKYGFVAYAHDDSALFRDFRQDLIAVERRFALTFQDDTGLTAGTAIDPRLQKMIEQAEIFILLASRAFVASGYIWNIELPAIRARLTVIKGLVIPVVLEGCAHDLIRCGMQAVPTVDGRVKPIRKWDHIGEGCDHARQQIDAAISHHWGIPGI
jgi:hypothetical protein